MNRWIVAALRAVIAIALLGSLAVQGLMIPLALRDMDGTRTEIRVAFAVLVFVGVLGLQLIGVSTWRLLTMVRRGTVFSFGAFRYVDRIIAAISVGAVVVFGFAVLGAYSNRTNPGDEVAPGLVGMVCVLALVVGGVALLVYVLRTLLTQAVALDDETKHLQAELAEVI
ncbi:DUF2975 domain-containing protein [Nocardioides daejeonensis]|uniref:DUF2975 domain-containing protein n=1 Tax=Nocardioides daejeonensis TaxID=1046556 RepID=UPI000D74450D|nr:DUF2975 domain-containing protein [Nocardioides daejeonensis]